MEIRQLRYFLKIADAGSFSRASQALHVAQSALSSRILELEQELGVRLLHRKRSGVGLSEHGRTFYAHAQRIVRQLDELPQIMRQATGGITGRVAIGLPASTALRFAAPLLDAAAEVCPGVGLELFDEPSGNLRRGIESGRLDLAVMVSDEDAHGLQAIALMDEELFFVAAPGTALPVAMPVADLASQRLALPSQNQGVRQLVEQAVRAAGVELPVPAVQANSLGIMLHSAERGLAASILPWTAVQDRVAAGTLQAVPLVPALSRRVRVCSAPEQPLSAAGDAVLALLLQVVRQQVARGAWRGVRLL